MIVQLLMIKLLISLSPVNTDNIEVININKEKSKIITVVSIPYETSVVYNNDKEEDTIITEGKEGFGYQTDGEIKVIREVQNEVKEVGTKLVYTGKMTGYGADCSGCSGSLSCRVNSKTWNLNTDGIYYEDNTYGKVRIISAPLTLFPCGSIITIDHPLLGLFNAIVLDTGSSMNSAWSSGIVHIDLAYASEKDSSIYSATSNNTKYYAKRIGW